MIQTIKAVIAANAKAGKYRATAAPYGYVKSATENRLPIPDEPAASVVRRIFEMRSKGTSPRHIADALKQRRFRFRRTTTMQSWASQILARPFTFGVRMVSNKF